MRPEKETVRDAMGTSWAVSLKCDPVIPISQTWGGGKTVKQLSKMQVAATYFNL